MAEKDYLPKEFKPLGYWVSREGLHWYVSISAIGINLGLKTLATLNTGRKYGNINKQAKIKKLEKRLKRLQRQVSRKYEMNKKGRNRYVKTKNIIKLEQRIAKLRSRIHHIRKHEIDKMTTEIVRTKPSHIVIEDLNVSGMMKESIKYFV